MATDWEPRVWVGCLACYNEGHLFGYWYTPDEGAEVTPYTLAKVLPAYHDPAAHEELWVFDSEGFEGFHDGEGSPADFQRVASTVQRIVDESAASVDAMRAWVDNDGAEYTLGSDDPVEAFQDAYCGEYGSLADYADEMLDEGVYGEVPENLRPYIDTERLGRDLGYDGYSESGGHVFRPC